MCDVRRGVVLDMGPNVSEGTRDDALVLHRALHCVRLARARLSVREHAPIEPVQDGGDQRSYLIKYNENDKFISLPHTLSLSK